MGVARTCLGDWVAEFLGVGGVVAPDADDLRARREEPRRHRRHHDDGVDRRCQRCR
jgi:hypothetical protein